MEDVSFIRVGRDRKVDMRAEIEFEHYVGTGSDWTKQGFQHAELSLLRRDMLPIFCPTLCLVAAKMVEAVLYCTILYLLYLQYVRRGGPGCEVQCSSVVDHL